MFSHYIYHLTHKNEIKSLQDTTTINFINPVSVCFVDRCLSFGHCVVFDVHILISPLASANSSY
jgi:hypothetical protein